MSKYPEYKHLNLPQISQEILADWKAKKPLKKVFQHEQANLLSLFMKVLLQRTGCLEFIM